MTRAAWASLLKELVQRNGGGQQFVYIQVSGGAEFGRNHAPDPTLKPTIFLMASPLSLLDERVRENGVAAVTVDDERWKRCDIKSTVAAAHVSRKAPQPAPALRKPSCWPTVICVRDPPARY
jgi:D-alanine transaminase